MTVIQKLRHFYDAKGISASSFDCPHRRDCKAGNTTFKTAREAYVGRHYESICPRLVFLSLDPGSDRERRNAARGMKRLQKDVERWTREECPRKGHRHWTLMLAVELLRPFVPRANRDSAVEYIAHTNSAKCCQNKPHGAQADPRLFEYCIDFIPGELERLAPDVIVTQGDKARRVLESAYQDTGEAIPGRRKLRNTKLVQIAGQTVLWIHMYHPTQRQSFFKTYDWPKKERYSNLMLSFVRAYRK